MARDIRTRSWHRRGRCSPRPWRCSPRRRPPSRAPAAKAPTPAPTPVPTPVPPERVSESQKKGACAERRITAVREPLRQLLEAHARRGGRPRQRRRRRGPRRGRSGRSAGCPPGHPGRRLRLAHASALREPDPRRPPEGKGADVEPPARRAPAAALPQTDDPTKCDELYAFRSVLFRFDDRPQVALQIVHPGEPRLSETHHVPAGPRASSTRRSRSRCRARASTSTSGPTASRAGSPSTRSSTRSCRRGTGASRS